MSSSADRVSRDSGDSGDGVAAAFEPLTAEAAALATLDAVNVDEAYRDSSIEEVLEELEREFVGLTPVKTRIREIASLLLITRLRAQIGLSADRPTLHMSFTGRPGTGKTTVALRMARILHRLGYVRKGHLVVATRDDLVGQYVGHTAPKTKEVVKRAMGGVLFIDEAYYLYRPDNERDYGQEAIEMLLQIMEHHRDDLVVILAGYKDRMETFYHSNPGFRSRIAHHIDFPDYSLDELMAIAELLVTRQQYTFDDESRGAFRDYLALRVRQPHFANARSVRNAIDRVKLRQASRLLRAGGMVASAELARLDATDIRRSRVFDEAPHATAADTGAPEAVLSPSKPNADTWETRS
jgi:probable Rubsico expression protein CbbX